MRTKGKRGKEKRISMAVFLCCVLLGAITILGGCGASDGGAEVSASQSESAASREMRIFTDSCGREVEVPAEIESIVPSGNLAQIFLYAIAPDALIGISGGWSDDAADYIDEKYIDLPEIGQFFGQRDLNYEEIASLNPDVIIDVGEDKDSIEEDMDDITEKTGIPVVHITATVDCYDEAFTMLGALLGLEEEAQELAQYCADAYQTAVDMMAEVDADDARKSLLYCVGEDGLHVIAEDSYHSEIIDLLSDNAAKVDSPSSKGTGNEVDIEQILKWNPDVILFAPGGYYDEAADNTLWGYLDAISSDAYYEVPIGPYNWMGFPPASNRVLGMIWMSELLYPEYSDYDMEEETVRYYDLFFHCDLTHEQYLDLTANSIQKAAGQQ